jgi:O-acetyl-ADP-ribose deacetylase (regulator of RNase III)
MDGGFDKVLTDYFGEQLMNRVQDYIIGRYAGEQPVGTSFIIETHNDKIPYLAHTPTMKVPSSIKESDNVYQAMKAMLLAVGQYEKASYKTELDNDSISIVNDTLVKHTLDSVACCGLGTSTGGVSCRSAAYQMAAAYKDFLNPPRQLSWRYALSKIEVRMTTIHENSD